MKQFNLEKALAGEPVKLRGGQKAYVKYVLSDEYNTDYPLRGFAEYKKLSDGKINTGEHIWTLNGNFSTFEESETDIIGMWEEPKCYINGIEVPEPVTEETWVDGGRYWYPTLDHNDYVRSDRFYTDVPIHTKLIRQGLVFKTEEDARIMAKALLNYTVEQRDE